MGLRKCSYKHLIGFLHKSEDTVTSFTTAVITSHEPFSRPRLDRSPEPSSQMGPIGFKRVPFKGTLGFYMRVPPLRVQAES